MSEFAKYIRLLRRYWYVLIGVPLFAAVLTFFLVRRLPDQYVSHARLATGLVDRSDEFLRADNNDQESKINQQFGNLTQLITTRKMVNQVSYLLMIHDLTKTPFRPLSPLVKQLNASARQNVVATCQRKYNNREELSLWNNDEKGINEVLKSMGYDYESLVKSLAVYRVGTSDFIDMEFTSPNPELSAFALNSLSTEFLTYYKGLIRENQNKAVNFLDSLVRQKETVMNNKMEELKNYKIRNRVLNLQEQAKAIYGQIADIETKREEAKKNVDAYSAALGQVNNKFNPDDRRYVESALINVNQNILATKEQLRIANNQYVQSGFEPRYRQQMDSLQNRLTAQIAQSTDKTIYSPLASKNDLIAQKLNLEVSLDLSKNSIASLNEEVGRLNQKIGQLVPNEAMIQAYENDIDIASREYIELLQKFNQTSMEAGFSTKLRLVEAAMPGEAKPSHKMLLVALAGMISFVLCLLVLFALFYFDDSITDATELANKTGVPVLGVLNRVNTRQMELPTLWASESLSADQQELKRLLRSLRFEVERELGEQKLLGVTSLSGGEGSTFVAANLAYAFAAMNKKVALVDGDFSRADLSRQLKTDTTVEALLQGGVLTAGKERSVTFVGTKGGDYSLLELADEETLRQKFETLTQAFDLVVVDMGSLENADKSKEWILLVQKLVSVFAINNTIKGVKQERIDYLKGLQPQYAGWVVNKAQTVLKKQRRKKGNA